MTSDARTHSNRGSLKVGVGLAMIFLIALFTHWFMISSLRRVYEADDWVMDIHAKALVEAEQLRYLAEAKGSNVRGYLLKRDEVRFLPKIQEDRERFLKILDEMTSQVLPNGLAMAPERIDLFRRLRIAEKEHQEVLEEVLRLGRERKSNEEINRYLLNHGRQLRDQIVILLDELVQMETFHLKIAREEASQVNAQINRAMNWVAAISILLLSLIAIFIFRLIHEGYRLLDESKRAVFERDSVLSVVSHDLKNPLSSVVLNTQLLARGLDQGITSTKAHYLTQSIQKSADRMSALIQDLLDLTKLESGNLVLDLKTRSVSEVVNTALDLFMPLFEAKSIHFELINEASQSVLKCDFERVMQVISNLLGNALKFTPSGGTVTFQMKENQKAVLFSVSDTGQGISPEQLPHLFDRFWQANRTGKLGTGLGLSIAKAIVEAHGSELLVASQMGQGSTFSFQIAKWEPAKTSSPDVYKISSKNAPYFKSL